MKEICWPESIFCLINEVSKCVNNSNDFNPQEVIVLVKMLATVYQKSLLTFFELMNSLAVINTIMVATHVATIQMVQRKVLCEWDVP